MGALADHYARLGETAQAVDLYRRLIELEPNNAVIHNNLAVALTPVDAEQALKSALRAYELLPTSAAVLDTVGWLMVQLGDLETGLARLREAVARNGRVPEIRYHLGVALEEYGNLRAARTELRRALADGAQFPGRDEAEKRLERIELFVP
jgi:Flp pilus assembly protein TadD